MPDGVATGTVANGVALLERAVSYTLGSLNLVTPDVMSGRTPCASWDLSALLGHMNDSLAALQEAMEEGGVRLGPGVREALANPAFDPARDPVAALRTRACLLVGAWNADDSGRVLVGGIPLPAGYVSSAGAVEVAVHGWDVATACGERRPLPEELAEELLRTAQLFVSAAERDRHFAPPLRLAPGASASDRLLAFLGRRPR